MCNKVFVAQREFQLKRLLNYSITLHSYMAWLLNGDLVVKW